MLTGGTKSEMSYSRLPDVSDEDVTAAEDEADANGCTYFYLVLFFVL